MKKFLKGLYLLFTNPYLASRYLKMLVFEQTVCHFFSPSVPFQRNIGEVLFNFRFTSNSKAVDEIFSESIKRISFEVYFDFYEIEVAENIKRSLRSGDVFIDVGAAVGYFSALGASLVGESGQIHCFEPSPVSFASLQELRTLNPHHNIIINNCAIGDQSDIVDMRHAKFPHLGGTSFVSGFMEAHDIPIEETYTVPIMRLDDYLEKNNLLKPRLIKIDVEGYEFLVLKGLKKYFERNPHRPDIICEIQKTAYPLLGFTLDEMKCYMAEYGYRAYDILNPTRVKDIARIDKESFNILWSAKKSLTHGA